MPDITGALVHRRRRSPVRDACLKTPVTATRVMCRLLHRRTLTLMRRRLSFSATPLIGLATASVPALARLTYLLAPRTRKPSILRALLNRIKVIGIRTALNVPFTFLDSWPSAATWVGKLFVGLLLYTGNTTIADLDRRGLPGLAVHQITTGTRRFASNLYNSYDFNKTMDMFNVSSVNREHLRYSWHKIPPASAWPTEQDRVVLADHLDKTYQEVREQIPSWKEVMQWVPAPAPKVKKPASFAV